MLIILGFVKVMYKNQWRKYHLIEVNIIINNLYHTITIYFLGIPRSLRLSAMSSSNYGLPHTYILVGLYFMFFFKYQYVNLDSTNFILSPQLSLLLKRIFISNILTLNVLQINYKSYAIGNP